MILFKELYCREESDLPLEIKLSRNSVIDYEVENQDICYLF